MTRWTCLALLLLLPACESSPVLPTTVEGPPPFSRVTFNQVTLSPTPGTSLAVGGTFDFFAEAFYEFASEDLAEDPYQSAEIWLETYREEDWGWDWVGDFMEVWTELEEGLDTGTVQMSGSLTLPAISPTCDAYDQIRITASIGWVEEEPRQASEKSGGGLRAEALFPVSGTVGISDPCAAYLPWGSSSEWSAGELIEFYVHNVWSDQDLSIVFPGGGVAPVLGQEYWPEAEGPGEAEIQVWIPPGATSGPVEILVDGEAAAYGAGRPTEFDIPHPGWDFGDPWNGEWESAEEDWVEHDDPLVAFLNPALAISEEDRIEDPTLNPWDLTGFGVGDWWEVEVRESMQLCVEVLTESADEVDLFVAQDDGTLVATQRAEGEGWEILTGPAVASGERILVWVAPISVTTELGVYTLTVAGCDLISPMSGVGPQPPERLPRKGGVR